MLLSIGSGIRVSNILNVIVEYMLWSENFFVTKYSSKSWFFEQDTNKISDLEMLTHLKRQLSFWSFGIVILMPKTPCQSIPLLYISLLLSMIDFLWWWVSLRHQILWRVKIEKMREMTYMINMCFPCCIASLWYLSYRDKIHDFTVYSRHYDIPKSLPYGYPP